MKNLIKSKKQEHQWKQRNRHKEGSSNRGKQNTYGSSMTRLKMQCTALCAKIMARIIHSRLEIQISERGRLKGMLFIVTIGKSMEGNLLKAVTSALKGREKAVDVAMKAVYWLCKEGIATRKYSSLLSFLELLNTPFVQDLKCGENASYSTNVIANEMQDAIAEVLYSLYSNIDILQQLQCI